MIIINTDRLELIPYQAQDLEWLHQTFTDPFVRKYLFDDQIITVEQVKTILDQVLQFFATESWGQWKIRLKHDGTYAGFVGFWNFFDEAQPQLLYGLLPQYTGKGIATEASRAIINYAFDQLRFNYILASFDKPNTHSQKVCERLGMRFVEEKLIEDKPTVFYQIDNQIVDSSLL